MDAGSSSSSNTETSSSPPVTENTGPVPQDLSFELWSTLGKGNYTRFKQIIYEEETEIDVNWRSKELEYNSLLHVACERGLTDFARALMRHPELNVDTINKHGITPLHLTITNKHVGCLRILLASNKVDLTMVDNFGNSPYCAVLKSGNQDCLRAWIISGRDHLIILNHKKYKDRWTIEIKNTSSAFQADLKRLETDPEKFQRELRENEGYFEHAASDLFATVVYLCDDFFNTRKPQAAKGSAPGGIQRYLASPGQMATVRFFGVVSRLPLELQMIICNRVYWLSRDLIPPQERETSFRQLVWSM